ncbi:phosphotransferase family protein [Streptomyces sp. SL13]|uniref:Phosphotransferase family protein n=1 Tax=Streptantibioticus silvisoli TaxID=2705255 RepID=A0AA90KA42_9ACTN|nr:phosphotransferase family protein [Streptantibioticus silvisoli]MDI5966280.1 phosphotransferase family protein [Streptantibioticus silvisoli]MDI5971622.1 phosphotransferase family protein [Streptantibioticus silvisoli]
MDESVDAPGRDDGPPGLDLGGLRTLLDRERPGLVAGPLTGRLIEGGRSNLTYAVGDGVHRWVVRRPPLGHVLATAHDMTREFTVISALHATPVPVPEAILLCDDTAVTGAPFYVMEYVDGVPYRSATELAPIGPERTRRVALALVDTLVDLHAVDPAAVGLAEFGRPDGFLERQLRRWGKQLAASRSRDLPGIDELAAALAARLPQSPAPTVVHGDYRLDNVLVGPDDTVRAVLDWEMSTLGDPLTDLGLLAMYSDRLPVKDSPVSNTREAPGHPDASELIERYATRSGRDVSQVAWYTAFAYFKLAVILEGIHYRFTLGQTVGAGFDRLGALTPVFIDQGLSALGTGR